MCLCDAGLEGTLGIHSDCHWWERTGSHVQHVLGTGTLDKCVTVGYLHVMDVHIYTHITHAHVHTHTRRFCRGCPINCDDSAFGDHSPYIAIDWDVNILHLKYQSAQERVRKNQPH